MAWNFSLKITYDNYLLQTCSNSAFFHHYRQFHLAVISGWCGLCKKGKEKCHDLCVALLEWFLCTKNFWKQHNDYSQKRIYMETDLQERSWRSKYILINWPVHLSMFLEWLLLLYSDSQNSAHFPDQLKWCKWSTSMYSFCNTTLGLKIYIGIWTLPQFQLKQCNGLAFIYPA